MTDIQDIERIQFRMQRIRNHMGADVDRLHADAAQLMDWKYYIRRHPVASLVAVSALGFFMVPKTRPTIEKKVYLDPEASREILRNQDTVRLEESEEVEEKAKEGILFSLGALAINALVKAGIAYATQQVRSTWLRDFTNVDKRT